MSDFASILWLSSIAGLATTLGAVLVIVMGHPQERTLAVLLAGAGGIMLSVVCFDLLPTARQTGSLLQVFSGFGTGALLMYLADTFLDRYRSTLPASRRRHLQRIGFLVAAGIALHDLPEGMAIAVGQEAADSLGFLIALAIAVHNLPEGMATAAPLKMAGTPAPTILAINLGIAAVTPLGALIGRLAIDHVQNALAFFLALAAGAMTFLVFAELLPLSRERHPRWALLGCAGGFTLFSLISVIHL